MEKGEYRILIEVDSNNNEMYSIAIYNEKTGKIEKWTNDFFYAKLYVIENGVFACEN